MPEKVDILDKIKACCFYEEYAVGKFKDNCTYDMQYTLEEAGEEIKQLRNKNKELKHDKHMWIGLTVLWLIIAIFLFFT